DAVGEIGGVAALVGAAVERRARRHVGGDVGDGDPDAPAALVLLVRIGLRIDRVVVVARVLGVDGDQRHVAQIGAAFQRRRLGGARLRLFLFAVAGMDAVRVHGQDRGGARIALAADDLLDQAAPGAMGALAAFDGEFDEDEIAVLGVADMLLFDQDVVARLAVGGLDPAAAEL